MGNVPFPHQTLPVSSAPTAQLAGLEIYATLARVPSNPVQMGAPVKRPLNRSVVTTAHALPATLVQFVKSHFVIPSIVMVEGVELVPSDCQNASVPMNGKVFTAKPKFVQITTAGTTESAYPQQERLSADVHRNLKAQPAMKKSALKSLV